MTSVGLLLCRAHEKGSLRAVELASSVGYGEGSQLIVAGRLLNKSSAALK
ncbi:hypothetical protein [Streptomyces sp. R35]|uniref:Uncharacterized protein n=1 Tax=Streptomyces sp. R35 TaxID=3238630 RepID=A0AB39SI86_9ACTN